MGYVTKGRNCNRRGLPKHPDCFEVVSSLADVGKPRQNRGNTIYCLTHYYQNRLIHGRKQYILPYNGFPKILGITLDERMSFDRHIQLIERKASGALKIIREVKGIAPLVSTKKLTNIYQSMVRSIVEYGAIIWQGGKNKTALDSVQRKGLSLCLNLP
ncbi:hypothetical protein DPMN_129021 [Dreissena polymorpha]|uniref:Uncharacterized protein n=1 Tax=Dreissena polymorpha TaxID=45954 RepID=A0A9D4K058_DREPO|nr:hypothetical protein DPMN_129021 [Dreissena polymorpha]